MASVFLFEHEEYWINFIQQNLQDVAGEQQGIDFVLATNVEEAGRVLAEYRPGAFDLLLVDLLAPPKAGVKPEYSMHAGEGFKVVEIAWQRGHRENIVVLSAIGDHPVTVAADRKLTGKGITYQVLDKAEDFLWVSDWKEHFGGYFEDLAPLVTYLESKLNIFVIDVKQHSTLRQLVRFVRATLRDAPSQTKLPVLCLSGPSRSGKSNVWAPSMPLIKQYLLYGGDPQGGQEPVRYAEFRLNALSQALTEAERAKIFGCYRWTAEGSSPIDEDGPLMEATYYCGRRPRVISAERNPANLRTDSRLGGYCLLDELLSCSTRVQEALYGPIDRRIVTTEGVGKHDCPINCTVILATNYDIGSAVLRGGRLEETGSIPEAMLNRIDAFVRTPSLQDLSFESVLKIIDRYKKGIQPVAVDALKRYHEDGTLSFERLRTLAVVEARGGRITKLDLERYVSTLTPPDLVPRGGKEQSQIDLVSVGATVGGSHDLEQADLRIGVLEWPAEVSKEDIGRAVGAWAKIQETDGTVLRDENGRNDVANAMANFNLSPGGLLALIIMGHSDARASKSGKERTKRWFGITSSNPMRAMLSKFSKRYPTVFRGAGKNGVVRMSDLEKWADSWTEQRRRASAARGK